MGAGTGMQAGVGGSGYMGSLDPMAQPYQNLATPTAGASNVTVDPSLYKNPSSPTNGMVWNESTGWQSPTSNTPGAMPSTDVNMPIATTSNPNTATLGTGQTTNPFNAATNPYIQAAQATTMGNLYGAQAATQANRINQNTPYGSLNYTQSFDANGNPVWTANQQLSQPLQNLTNTSLQGLQQSLQNPAYGINPGQTYSEAIMQRLQPQMAQQREAIASDLANQGIVPGTRAYDNAMRTFNQQQNDLLTSAQISGMQTGLQAQQLQNQQAANIKNLANPNYINPYTQAAVAGPDYLGAYTTSRAADIAAQNAQAARTANLQNGLFGLGSSAILGAGGVGNLGQSILGGATTLGGLLGLGQTSADYMNSIGATSSGMFDQAMSSNDYLNNLYGDLGIF